MNVGGKPVNPMERCASEREEWVPNCDGTMTLTIVVAGALQLWGFPINSCTSVHY